MHKRLFYSTCTHTHTHTHTHARTHARTVRTFRKHVGDRLVGLLHEIVDNHQRRFFTVKVLDIRKTLVKFCVGILVKELLVSPLPNQKSWGVRSPHCRLRFALYCTYWSSKLQLRAY